MPQHPKVAQLLSGACKLNLDITSLWVMGSRVLVKIGEGFNKL